MNKNDKDFYDTFGEAETEFFWSNTSQFVYLKLIPYLWYNV